MIVIGVDPGLSGAVAFLPAGREAFVVDMPVKRISDKGFVKNAVDVELLARVIRVNTTGLDLIPARAYVERVSAFPGQGVASMFSLGMSYWGVVGVLAALGIPVRLVEPKEWKAYFKLAKDKNLARGLAHRLYPGVELNMKSHHGRAEALLIARYGQLTTETK